MYICTYRDIIRENCIYFELMKFNLLYDFKKINSTIISTNNSLNYGFKYIFVLLEEDYLIVRNDSIGYLG